MEKTEKQKTAVVTGATSGIGLAIASELAAKGINVIGIGRDSELCKKVKNNIESLYGDVRIEYLTADLSKLSHIRQLSSNIKNMANSEDDKSIDILINNAATVSSWFVGTEDGLELQFAVNHLAPFLLTHELLPLLAACSQGRVITVSSSSHYRTRIRWNDILMRKNYNCLKAYKQSKLANVLFTAELNRRSESNMNLIALAADPGLVNTNIGLKGTSGIVRWVWKKRSKKGVNPKKAAQSIVYLALTPDINRFNEIYWKDCKPKRPGRYAQKEDNASKLWKISEKMCGIKSADYGL